MKKITIVLLAALLTSCMSVTWHNPDSGRDFTTDRNMCENTRASELGVTHCMRQLGWDADLKDSK